ncbi:MAG: S-layer homology domain-containing protein [Clostridia bacterium]|nr:S-layer homology domain-containing protein [Clostridia bacterium]
MKKIFSILVVLTLVSASVFAYAAPLNETQKTDLYNFGIMTGDENDDLRLDDTITRAEAIKMICVAGNITMTEAGEDSGFPDVPDSHWAKEYIFAAKEQGIIAGDENGNFNPESNVTNEETIKMIVCLLGYETFARDNGGYPAGYQTAASRIGITQDMQLGVNIPAIRNDVGVMIANALDIPLMVLQEENGDTAYWIADGMHGLPYITLRTTLKTENE